MSGMGKVRDVCVSVRPIPVMTFRLTRRQEKRKEPLSDRVWLL